MEFKAGATAGAEPAASDTTAGVGSEVVAGVGGSFFFGGRPALLRAVGGFLGSLVGAVVVLVGVFLCAPPISINDC